MESGFTVTFNIAGDVKTHSYSRGHAFTIQEGILRVYGKNDEIKEVYAPRVWLRVR